MERNFVMAICRAQRLFKGVLYVVVAALCGPGLPASGEPEEKTDVPANCRNYATQWAEVGSDLEKKCSYKGKTLTCISIRANKQEEKEVKNYPSLEAFVQEKNLGVETWSTYKSVNENLTIHTKRSYDKSKRPLAEATEQKPRKGKVTRAMKKYSEWDEKGRPTKMLVDGKLNQVTYDDGKSTISHGPECFHQFDDSGHEVATSAGNWGVEWKIVAYEKICF